MLWEELKFCLIINCLFYNMIIDLCCRFMLRIELGNNLQFFPIFVHFGLCEKVGKTWPDLSKDCF